MTQQQNVDFVKIFSERLKGLRGDRKKAEFARFLGVSSPQTYQNYEAGRIPEPEILINIADKCGVTVDWLFGREPTMVLRESTCEYRVTRAPGSKKITYNFLISWTTNDLQKFLAIAHAAEDWGLVTDIAALLQERKKKGVVPLAGEPPVETENTGGKTGGGE